MKLLILGATGDTGKELVTQALEQGHIVTAFTRNPADVIKKHDSLSVMQGNILDYTSVQGAVKGQDAVLSALGIRILKKNTIISDGTGNIINAMEKYGVKRFICMSSIGVGNSIQQKKGLGFLYNYIMIPFVLKNMFSDKKVQETCIKESDLNWTIIRPVILTKGKKTGKAKCYSYDDINIKAKISRADVAYFMLKQLSCKTNIHKTISLSY